MFAGESTAHEALREVRDRVEAFIKALYSKVSLRDGSTQLLSTLAPLFPGQPWHQDGRTGYSVIMSLSRSFHINFSKALTARLHEVKKLTEADLHFTDVQPVTVPFGSLVIFKSDEVHAGASSHVNHRLFMHFAKSAGDCLPTNEVFPVPKTEEQQRLRITLTKKRKRQD